MIHSYHYFIVMDPNSSDILDLIYTLSYKCDAILKGNNLLRVVSDMHQEAASDAVPSSGCLGYQPSSDCQGCCLGAWVAVATSWVAAVASWVVAGLSSCLAVAPAAAAVVGCLAACCTDPGWASFDLCNRIFKISATHY